MTDWIDIDEMMPPVRTRVLVMQEKGDPYIGELGIDNNQIYFTLEGKGDHKFQSIKYWMPLPEPYEKLDMHELTESLD